MDIYYARRIMREQHLSIFDMELIVTYYARVSTKTEEQQNSKENQIEHFEDFISRNTKWTLVKGYVDDVRGESAANRENFLRMVEDAKRGKFDYIFTKETSRFGRDLIDCVSYTRELMSYGVCVYFESDGINTIDPDAELKLGLMATLAQEEVRKLSERVKFGHKRSIQSNRILGNDRIFGYHYNKNGLTVNEEEARMVRKLFELYATDQYSLRQLEDIIWGMGYVGRSGTKVSHHTFANIIRNPKYKGYYCGGKVRIEDYRTKKQRFLPEEEWRMFKDESGQLVPQIVSEELWERANIILARRSSAITNHRSSLKKNSPFTGMIFCTVDGKPYWRQSNTLKSGLEYMWLCSEKRRHGTSACPSFAIYERELYQLLSDALLPKLRDISQSVNDYLECYARSGGSQEGRQEIQRLEKAIEKVERKKDRLLDLSLDDSITKAEFVKRNDALTAELEPLEEELERLRRRQEKDPLVSDVEDLRRYFLRYLDELSGEKITLTDAIIKKLIQRIEVTPKNEREMELNIVLKTQQETRALYQSAPRRTASRRRIEPGIAYKAQSGPPQPILRSGNMGKKMIESYESSMSAK